MLLYKEDSEAREAVEFHLRAANLFRDSGSMPAVKLGASLKLASWLLYLLKWKLSKGNDSMLPILLQSNSGEIQSRHNLQLCWV